jgi:hypothetical protein
VGLVGVAGFERQLDEGNLRRRQRLEPAKAEHAGEHLGAVADRLGHPALELACAQPELVGNLGHAGVGAIERIDRGADQRIGRRALGAKLDRAAKERVRIAAGVELGEQRLGRFATQHHMGVGRLVAQFGGRHAQHRAGHAGAQANAHDARPGSQCDKSCPGIGAGDGQSLA